MPDDLAASYPGYKESPTFKIEQVKEKLQCLFLLVKLLVLHSIYCRRNKFIKKQLK